MLSRELTICLKMSFLFLVWWHMWSVPVWVLKPSIQKNCHRAHLAQLAGSNRIIFDARSQKIEYLWIFLWFQDPSNSVRGLPSFFRGGGSDSGTGKCWDQMWISADDEPADVISNDIIHLNDWFSMVFLFHQKSGNCTSIIGIFHRLEFSIAHRDPHELMISMKGLTSLKGYDAWNFRMWTLLILI